jgi:hypothetical protein
MTHQCYGERDAIVVPSRHMKCAEGACCAAQQPHAAIGEIDNVHALYRLAGFSISGYAPKVRRAVADAGR